MKTLIAVLFTAQCACAQLIPTYGRPHTVNSDIMSGMNTMSGTGSGEVVAPQSTMHSEDRSGLTAKEMVGDGYGTMLSYQMRPHAANTLGLLTGSYYMLSAGATVVPIYLQARHNFWMTRGDGVYGAAYGYAAGGPTLGFGQSLFAPSVWDYFRTMTFRIGAGAMTGLGAEFGGSAFGWSVFTEVGAMGMAFTATLGPQRAYAAPFFAIGLRRGL